MNRKYVKIIITSALCAIIGIFLYYLSFANHLSPPQILISSPSNGADKIALTSQISLRFDKDVSSTDFTFKSSPAIDWSIEQVDQNTLYLKPNRLYQPSSKYQLDFTWRGIVLPPLIFTTEKAQVDPQLIENLNTIMDRDYPLGNKTPYEGPQYRVVYSGPLTLEISLKSASITEAQAINEIRSWVSREGGDATLHNYKVVPFAP